MYIGNLNTSGMQHSQGMHTSLSSSLSSSVDASALGNMGGNMGSNMGLSSMQQLQQHTNNKRPLPAQELGGGGDDKPSKKAPKRSLAATIGSC
jgi:hypothetical protein